jgi:hypothetical protein
MIVGAFCVGFVIGYCHLGIVALIKAQVAKWTAPKP